MIGLLIVIVVVQSMFIFAQQAYTDAFTGSQFMGNVALYRVSEPITKMYIVRCLTSLGKALHLFTHNISHHGFLIFTDHLSCIVSRMSNMVQVVEVREICNDGVVYDVCGYKYYPMKSVSLNNVPLGEFIEKGVEVASRYKYSYFSHNCQEFVNDILKEYDLIESDESKSYKGGLSLVRRGINDVFGNVLHTKC